MKILIDCSNHFCDNMNHGDIAMFVMMTRRLRNLWPECEIRLVTLDPALIERHVPGVRPLVLPQRHNWQLFPPRFVAWTCGPMRWWWRLRHWGLNLVARMTMQVSRSRIAEVSGVAALLEEIRTADLILATGGGYFSDNFPEHACGILDTLVGGHFFGTPSAIIGGGFEEVRNPYLCAKARSVLPRLDLITCREGAISPRTLSGVRCSLRSYPGGRR